MAFVTGFSFGADGFRGGGGVGGVAHTRPRPNQTQQPQAGTSNVPSAGGPTNIPTGLGSGGGGISWTGTPMPETASYGMQHPYFTDPRPVAPPPPAPTSDMRRDFIPDILGDPYANTINNAQNQANWFGLATPAAAQFLTSMFGDGMSPMEQSYVGAAATLGARNLSDTHNRIEGMFENSASHGSLAPAMLDATNQFNAQLNSMVGQMGTTRQNIASNLVPFAAGFPIQAGQAGMEASQGLYDMGQNMMYGDSQYPMAVVGSNIYTPPVAITQPK